MHERVSFPRLSERPSKTAQDVALDRHLMENRQFVGGRNSAGHSPGGGFTVSDDLIHPQLCSRGIPVRLVTLLSATLALGILACASEETPTGPALVAAARPYIAVDLGTAGENSGATDVNSRGQIVGQARSVNPIGVVWDKGVQTDLGSLGRGGSTQPWAINAAGQIVGGSPDPTGQTHAFLWEKGVMSDLGTLGGEESFAFAINPEGQVVGNAWLADGSSHAFLWEKGAMTDLGILGGCCSVARGINPRGQVVGNSQVAAGGSHAFLWENGVMTDLGTLGGESSVAIAVNPKGQVVGSSNTGPDETHAFLWEKGVMRDLGLLGGVNLSFAADINNAGQVVGYFNTPGGGLQAFVWDDGIVTLLDTPPGGSSTAVGINDRGDVVGGTQQIVNGEVHATLWTRKQD
jgi:probable HAF family extracellular repeat protein